MDKTRRQFLKTTGAGIALSVMLSLPAKNVNAREKKRKRPNILWIMMDDCRADALGCYGKSWPRTPNMDAIAAQGLLFKTAIVQNPVCVPSRTSMKSGHYAHTTGIMSMGRLARRRTQQLKPKPNLLNAWKRVGINPALVGKTHAYRNDWDQRGDVMPYFGVDGNVRDKKDWAGSVDKARAERIKAKLRQAGRRYPAAVTKTHKWAIGGALPLEPQQVSTWALGTLAVDTLEQLSQAGGLFFLRVSFHAPHVPCRVPDAYMIDPDKITLPLPTEHELKTKPPFEQDNIHIYSGADLTNEQIGIARGTYYGMVSLLDVQVGRLLEVLKKAGLYNNTIIAINSDQGFQLGEHGFWKKRCFYEQNVCVPFILTCPDLLPQGKVIDEPVEMIDFLPTLMELSEFDVPNEISGKSLIPLIKGRVKEWRLACFCEHDYATDMYEELRNGGHRCVMVRTKQWKLIYFFGPEAPEDNSSLYNLEEDPDEKNNLYGKPEFRHVVKLLQSLAEKWDKTA